MIVKLHKGTVLFAVMGLFLGGCARPSPEIERPELSKEPPAVYPTPVPVAPEPVEPGPTGKAEFVRRLLIDKPVATTVVLARVQRLSASERTVPAYVWPEEQELLIVTKATLLIDEALCGGTLSGRVDVSYVGGRVGKRWMRTSLMTQDLSPGQEYVLVLSKVADEYFLVGGRAEWLVPVPRESGIYKDFMGREVNRQEILGGCQ